MTANCPTCGKPVDTLRSRHVKVRGIQVVAYCSAECLAQAEPSVPVTMPRIDSPPAGMVKAGVIPDSGPVIEIQYEPASGVVTSAPDTRAQTGPVPKAEPDIPKVDLIKLQKQEQKEKSDKIQKALEKKSEPPKKKSEPKLAVVKAEPEKKPEPKAEPKPEPKPVDKKKLSVIDEVPKGSGTSLGSGPRKRGRETMQRDQSNVEQSEDWLDDEPANIGAVRAGTDVGDIAPASSGAGKKVLVTLLIVALLAGGGVLAYQLTRGKPPQKSTPSASGSGSQRALRPGSGDTSGSDPGSGSGLKPRVVGPTTDVEGDPRDKATGILKRYLETKDSPRIQRKAAMAWVRTGEKAAVDRLATSLADKDLEQAGRLEIAYYLARAGDKRGLDVLYASLASPRRDDKLVAARMLTELEDKRAIDTLASYLDVSQNRLGSAELLAKLGDARGVKVLEQIRADEKSSAEDKATATIALGYAGKDVTEDLHKLLADPRFNKFAADVLASRHDEAARATLVKQLDVTGLRVEAARALRRLSPDGDFGPYVKKLMIALDDPTKQRDTEQIPTAEAILLLSGPAKWADRA